MAGFAPPFRDDGDDDDDRFFVVDAFDGFALRVSFDMRGKVCGNPTRAPLELHRRSDVASPLSTWSDSRVSVQPLHPLPVVDVQEAARGQLALVLNAAGTAVARDHAHAGQYALVQLGDDVARPFAIASAPGEPKIEFLLKLPADRAAVLLGLARGDRVPVSAPRGPGFPLAQAQGRPLWLIGTGSGVAPLKAVVEALLPERARYADVHLLYGVRQADELAYAQRFGEWAGRGVHVVPVVSQPAPGTWDGPRGRVQDHLPAQIDGAAEAWFFLCGLPEMDREVAATLLQRGVAPDQIFRNY